LIYFNNKKFVSYSIFGDYFYFIIFQKF